MPEAGIIRFDLKARFFRVFVPFETDESLVASMWVELEKLYTAPDRHYHNLTHIGHLFLLLEPCREKIEDWATLSLAVFYHDAVYNVLKSDNEIRSAELAEARLRSAGLPENMLARIRYHILATQKHDAGEDPDTCFFTDADLAILGADLAEYQAYACQIRQEYAVYPDLLYNPGRKKVLNHFLAKPAIFKTPEFRAHFEENARNNLRRELEGLIKA